MSEMREAAVGTKVYDQALIYGPSLVLSILVAETFYKFGSFSLEFVAWAATFGVLIVAQRGVMAVWRPRD